MPHRLTGELCTSHLSLLIHIYLQLKFTYSAPDVGCRVGRSWEWDPNRQFDACYWLYWFFPKIAGAQVRSRLSPCNIVWRFSDLNTISASLTSISEYLNDSWFLQGIFMLRKTSRHNRDDNDDHVRLNLHAFVPPESLNLNVAWRTLIETSLVSSGDWERMSQRAARRLSKRGSFEMGR